MQSSEWPGYALDSWGIVVHFPEELRECTFTWSAQPPVQLEPGSPSLRLKCQRNEACHVSTSTSEVQSEWSSTSTHPCAFVACTGTTLFLNFEVRIKGLWICALGGIMQRSIMIKHCCTESTGLGRRTLGGWITPQSNLFAGILYHITRVSASTKQAWGKGVVSSEYYSCWSWRIAEKSSFRWCFSSQTQWK